MRSCAKFFASVLTVLVSVGLAAQEVYHSHDPDLLARFSYENSAIMQAGSVRHICVAVSRDGIYRTVRTLNGQTQRLQGKMSDDQFQQLKALLGTAEFRALSGDHGGLIRQEFESFGAEIPMAGGNRTQRLQWLNADRDNPFPDPVVKVIDWLKRFEPTNGRRFERTDYPDVCPSVGLRMLQPSVAANVHP
jgi:hypothetical protein